MLTRFKVPSNCFHEKIFCARGVPRGTVSSKNIIFPKLKNFHGVGTWHKSVFFHIFGGAKKAFSANVDKGQSGFCEKIFCARGVARGTVSSKNIIFPKMNNFHA